MDDAIPFIPDWRLGRELFRGVDLVLAEATREREAASDGTTQWMACIPSAATLVNRERRDAFLAAHSLLQHVRHPALARVAVVGMVDAQPYAIVERVPGQSLRSLLDAGSVDGDRVGAIAACLAGGLAVCHSRGLLLQSLAPGTVFVDDTNCARLSGFRFARAPDFTPREGSGFYWASLAQAAPEQIAYYAKPEDRAAASPALPAPAGPPDARADIFAWGMLVGSLLTGRYPAVERGEDPKGTLAIPREPLRVPGPLAAIVERATRYAPEERWPDAAALCQALAALPARA